MQTAYSWHLKWAVLITVLIGSSVAFGQTEEFELFNVRQENEQIKVYHSPVVATDSAEWQVMIGGKACEADPASVNVTARGGDGAAVIIVIDRGGNKASGMGKYGDEVFKAVKQATENAFNSDSQVVIGYRDLYASNKPARVLSPTKSKEEVGKFCDPLPPPETSGVDIYGQGLKAVTDIQELSAPLRTVILITDGIDPDAKRGTADTPNKLIANANRMGVRIGTVQIDRVGEKLSTRRRANVKRSGATLSHIAMQTGGRFRSVPVGDKLAERLEKVLSEMARDGLLAARTTCKACGKFEAGNYPVSITVKDGEKISSSRNSNAAKLALDDVHFGACEAEKKAVDCTADDACGRCKVCNDGICKRPKCESSEDCREGCDCVDGWCDRGSETPWSFFAIAGGLLSLLLIVFLVSSSKGKKARAQLAEDNEKRRQEQEALKIEMAAAEERQRQELARMEQESERKRQEEAERLNPLRIKLISVDPPIEKSFRAGRIEVGALPDNDWVLDHPTISGQHCVLTVGGDGRAFVEDNGSSNGTFINQYRLEPHGSTELRAGDELAISSQLVFIVEIF